MIRLLRHDPSIPREDDGTVRFDDVMEEIQGKVRWYFAVQWSADTWMVVWLGLNTLSWVMRGVSGGWVGRCVAGWLGVGLGVGLGWRWCVVLGSTPPQVMSPKGSSSTGFWSIHKIKELTIMMILRKMVSNRGLACSQSLVHSAYDSAESIATPPDSDLEDERLRTMLASPLYIQEREEDEGQVRAHHSEQ